MSLLYYLTFACGLQVRDYMKEHCDFTDGCWAMFPEDQLFSMGQGEQVRAAPQGKGSRQGPWVHGQAPKGRFVSYPPRPVPGGDSANPAKKLGSAPPPKPEAAALLRPKTPPPQLALTDGPTLLPSAYKHPEKATPAKGPPKGITLIGADAKAWPIGSLARPIGAKIADLMPKSASSTLDRDGDPRMKD